MDYQSGFLMLGALVAGYLAGMLGARQGYIDLLHRLSACESFLRARNVAEARRAQKDRQVEQIEAWRARGSSGLGIEDDLARMAREVPRRDDGVPR